MKPTESETESKNRIANQALNPPYYQHHHPPFRRLWDDCEKNDERNAEFYRYRRLSMIAVQGSRRKDHESHLLLVLQMK
jgi:hypothetical protein